MKIYLFVSDVLNHRIEFIRKLVFGLQTETFLVNGYNNFLILRENLIGFKIETILFTVS